MAINYSWNIAALDVEDIGGNVDVVVAVHWRREGDKVVEYGVAAIPPPAGPFIPFDQLKKTDVTGWLESSLTPAKVAQIDAAIAGVVNSIASPKVRRKTDVLK